MADIAVVNSKIEYLNVLQALTLTAANEDGAGVAQKFVYTPTGKDNKLCIVIYNGTADEVDVTISAGVGAFAAAAKVDQIPDTAGYYIMQIETGKYMQANGTIEITVDPNNVLKKLLSDHALTVGVVELQ